MKTLTLKETNKKVPYDEKKLCLMIGMCERAGKLIIGTEQICTALKTEKSKNKVCVVLEASDVSENTHKRLTDRCAYYNTEKIKLPINTELLAKSIGKTCQVAAVAVTDSQMSRAVMSLLPESQNQS